MSASTPSPRIPEASEADRHSLAAAFAYFSETSEQLASSYHLLEKRVEQLSRELDSAAKEKEQARKSKNQIATRMRALLDFLPGGVVVLDARGYVVEANPAARALLEYDVQGQLWRKVIGKCFAPKNDDGLEVSTHGGKRISIATSSLDNDGQIILLTDQTETRRLQENVSRAEKFSAMGKMVSALAHQIRTPLATALLYSGHLCNGELEPVTRAEFSRKLKARLQHMETQVRDMLLFVKSELPLNQQISLADLEIGLREAAEVPLATAGARCEWRNLCPDLWLKCNREALISALMNLVNNAIQASEVPARLRIDFFACGEGGAARVQVRISDCGAGMNHEQLANAQQMFVTTKAQGTGLGLSVVQSVARAHGGALQIESEIGVGTQATISMPTLPQCEIHSS